VTEMMFDPASTWAGRFVSLCRIGPNGGGGVITHKQRNHPDTMGS
jgi:hypothetical protein